MDREDEDVHPPRLGSPWGPEWDPEGVIRVLEPLVLERRLERIRRVVDGRLDGVTVVMDAPFDPHNGSAVVRSCDALGVQTVHVVPREHQFLVARRVAKGTERWIDVRVHRSVVAAASHLEGEGYELVAAAADGDLTPEDLAAIPRLALVVGNEHDGICAELRRAASRTVRIPMRGFVESLNVSVAAAILLRAATQDRRGDLSVGRRRELYARGLFTTVPRAREVLAAALGREAPGNSEENPRDRPGSR